MINDDWIFSRRLSSRIGFPAIGGFLAAMAGYIVGSPHSIHRMFTGWTVATLGLAIVKEVVDKYFPRRKP
jgi:hypothetical protein